jgi:two-component system cell cycle response regulator
LGLSPSGMSLRRTDPDNEPDRELTEPAGRAIQALVESHDNPSIHPTEDKILLSVPPVCDRPTLTMLTGPEAGSIHTVEAHETLIGRAEACQVRLEDLGASRRHARIVRLPDGAFALEDLGSRNGTTIHGVAIQRHQLADGDRIGIGPSVFLRFAFTDQTEEELLRRLYTSSILDALTGIVNRAHLFDRLEAELAYARRHESPLSFLLFDLDHFKRVNDTLGHLAGDHVLRTICTLVKGTLRVEDIFARYGGEEFAIVARGIDFEKSMLFAERIRLVVERAGISYDGQRIAVTISIGVAALSGVTKEITVEELVALADSRLYAAKRAGRNRSVGQS